MQPDGARQPTKGAGRTRFLALALAVLALGAALWLPRLLAAWGGPAGAVRAYLAAMRDQRFEKALSLLDDGGDVGLDPRAAAASDLSPGPGLAGQPGGAAAASGPAVPGGAAPAGGRPASAALDMLAAQRAMIAAEFGARAWNRPAFQLERIPSLGQALRWRAADGRWLSAAEARRRLDAFWARVAADHGVDLSLALSPPPAGAAPQEAGSGGARMGRLLPVIEEHRGQSPVRLEAVPTYATYLARLDFGHPAGRSGCQDITLTVTNRTGAWRVSNLQWCGPERPAPRDV